MDDVIIRQTIWPNYKRHDEALVAMRKSGYQANMSKTQAPSSKISVFEFNFDEGVMSHISENGDDFLIDFYSKPWAAQNRVKTRQKLLIQGKAKLFKLTATYDRMAATGLDWMSAAILPPLLKKKGYAFT